MSKPILIIGGGAAGLMTALTAAELGLSVVVLERNEKPGKKIYITGKGRCNVTNQCPPDEFLKNVTRNPRFLFSALHAFPPQAMIDELTELGCPTVVERGNRVFPASGKASDVTRALTRRLEELGVSIRLNCRVRSLLIEDKAIAGVVLENNEVVRSETVIVCTGGVSYPTTGSTGDGYRLLKDAGHTIVPPKPALCGLLSDALWIKGLQGLSLKNVRLVLTRGKKVLQDEIGEMLFTHRGISGPLVLTASSLMAGEDDCALSLDLKPGLTEEMLERRLLRDIGEAGKKQMISILRGLFPESLALAVGPLAGINLHLPACELSKAARRNLISLTKALPLPIIGAEPIEHAVITAGGADVREFNPKTMESKKISGLYAAGEVLDVDALTGGFNLHIAFATGYSAARAFAD